MIRARREHVFIALVAAVLALSVVFEFPFCPFAALTGIPCPGCGLGRATLALLRGDLHAALHLHPLVLAVVPALALVVGVRATNLRIPPRADRWLTAAATGLVATLVVVWVVRFTGALGGPAPVLSVWAAAAR